MTEAYAIKGLYGIEANTTRDSEAECWSDWLIESELTRDVSEARGYRCVPVTVSENTTPTCQNCGATSWADFYRGSSVIASVCKKCDHKITPPVTAVSEKGEAPAHGLAQSDHPTAEPALSAGQNYKSVWKPDELERIIDQYVKHYELNDGETCYDPSDEERIIIKDAIMGLLVDREWDAEWGKHIASLAAISYLTARDEVEKMRRRVEMYRDKARGNHEAYLKLYADFVGIEGVGHD